MGPQTHCNILNRDYYDSGVIGFLDSLTLDSIRFVSATTPEGREGGAPTPKPTRESGF